MTSINGNYLILPQKYYQNSQIPSAPAFRGGVESNPLPAQATQPLSYPPDTVEISATDKIKKPKDKMSTAAKAGVTALGVLGGLAIGAVCFAKHQSGKLTKLYNEKMQLVNLAEKIDFKEAKTVDEGIKFAKEVLKIGEVDSNFTLDAINYANRGLVDVSNANKGHLFMPKKMHFVDAKDKYSACVIQTIDSPHFGELYINSRNFNNKELDEWLQGSLGLNKKEVAETAKKTTDTNKKQFTYFVQPDNHTKDLLSRYRKDTNSLTITEKRDQKQTLINASEIRDAHVKRAPLTTLNIWKNDLTKAGINVDVEEFKKLSTEKQAEQLNELLSQLHEKICKNLGVPVPFVTARKTIYHEMGHLQDFAKNLKELDLKHWKFSWSEAWKEADKNVKEGHLFKSNHSAEIDHVDNRWGGLTYSGYKELFEKNPAKFKKRYPDLYEFLTNQEYQQAAGKVSEYAQTSIGEFIAETYAKMVRGDKIPDDVMKLYEKYNGPKLGG